MAKIELLDPIVLKWETDKYTENKNDRGGPTKYGITLATWQSQGYDKNHDGHIDKEDVKLLTVDDYNIILGKFWNAWKADQIKNQSVANLLVDWVWASGYWGIAIPQRVLKVHIDGKVGPQTLSILNNVDQRGFFNAIKFERSNFLANIVKNDPRQQTNINGWINRLNSFKYSD